MRATSGWGASSFVESGWLGILIVVVHSLLLGRSPAVEVPLIDGRPASTAVPAGR